MNVRTQSPPVFLAVAGPAFRRVGLLVILIFLPAVLSSRSAAGDDGELHMSDSHDGTQEASNVKSEKEPSTESGLKKLQIFGHLTQAWAKSRNASGGFRPETQDEVILGIPPGGTTDYRTLALMFRYQMTDQNHLTIQLSSRDLGTSPIGDLEDEIELDWAYYEHRFGSQTRLRVGRFPSPIGLLNEVRDVGLVLPFFRTPFVFYREGSYTSETVDGVFIRNTLSLPATWNLELNAFAGEWDLIEFAPPGAPLVEPAGIARAREALGLTFMFTSPGEGFRIGAGGQWYDVEGGVIRNPGEQTPWHDYHASLEIQRGRLLVRAEARWARFVSTNVLPGGVKADSNSYYLQIGYQLNDRWGLFLQREDNPSKWQSPFLAAPFRVKIWEDTAIAVNRRFSSFVVAKAEFHTIAWEDFDVIGFENTPSGPKAFVGTRRATGGRQVIVSLSTGF